MTLQMTTALAGERVPTEAYSAAGPKRVGYLLVAAVATMPILTPAGPGNTATADATIAAAVVITTAWLRRLGVKIRVPYLLGMGLLMLAGSIAALHAGSASSALTVLQDAFGLLWATALANAVRQRSWLLRNVLRAWVYSGVAWAGVLCFGRIAGINWMAGITPKDGKRASLTFNDPNLAANYFLCCLALLLATSVLKHRLSRVTSVLLLLLALVFTGSNGAATGLCLLLGAGFLLWVRNHHGITGAIAVVTLGAVLVGVSAPYVSLDQVRQRAADSVQLLRDSLGRTGESTGTRQALFSEEMRLYLHGNLIGVAPGRTKATLRNEAAPYVKEAHNDYMATLVERGALGGLGLVFLLCTIGLRLGRVARWPQSETVRALVPRPEYLLGLGLAFVVSAVFYEVLHFRHLWAFLGVVAGIDPGWTRWRRP
jgi:O-antigen ligase